MTHGTVRARRASCFTALCLMLAVATMPAAGQTFTALYDFGSGINYQGPSGPMIIGRDGSLYGVTVTGGLGFGTVFQLSPPAVPGGTWTETAIYSFKGGVDGYRPAEGLSMDKGGNLYGSTLNGGITGGCNCGLVFKLKPPAAPGGTWSKRTMHAFTATNGDGADCCAPLYVDSKGVVYGTTFSSSANGQVRVGGTIFQIKSQGSGFVETILHDFLLTPGDGQLPETQLVGDAAGNLYGTTYQGGANGFGTVYKLSPPAGGNGAWTETILYDFRYGNTASSALVMGSSSQLFGTGSDGGIDNEGNIFRLTPPKSGQGEYSRTALWSFLGAGNGSSPGGLALDPATGIFYGVTAYSDHASGCGVAYQLAPPATAGGAWQYSVLHYFSEAEGCLPTGPIIRAADGTLYGVTETMAYQIKL